MVAIVKHTRGIVEYSFHICTVFSLSSFPFARDCSELSRSERNLYSRYRCTCHGLSDSIWIGIAENPNVENSMQRRS